MNAPLLAAMLASILIQPAQTFSPDAEGFIRNWLVLAPDRGAGGLGRDRNRKGLSRRRSDDQARRRATR